MQDVTWASWFGGIYKDPKNFFAQFAIEPESYLRMYPEILLTPDERKAFLDDRTGCIVGDGLAKIYGFKVGDKITLQVGIPIYGQQDFDFTVRAIYRSGGAAVDNQSMMFHWKYADERSLPKGQVGWFVTQIANPDQAAQVSAAIDQKFANSPYETKTDTEQAFQSSFVSMFGNLNLLLGSIALAVVITTLFVAGNTMAMSVRERTTEIAVMRTLGFPSATIFLLVAGEGLLMSIVGGVVGRRSRAGDRQPRFPPGGRVHPGDRRQQREHDHGARAERAHRPARRADSGDDGLAAQDRRRVAARRVTARMQARDGSSFVERPLRANVMGLITNYNLRSMIVRKGTAAMTAGGIAMVVAVFVMTLAIAQGFRATLVASGSPQNAIVLRKGATAETVSAVLRTDVPIIESLPQVARGADGRALASPELVDDHRAAAAVRQPAGQRAGARRRPKAFEVRDTLTFVEGRRFTPGTREINVGRLAVGRFKGLTLGSDVKFGSATWKVVGVFTADDASFESEVWGDVDLMMPAFQRNGYQSITVKLADPSMFDSFKAAVEATRASTCSRSASRTTTPNSRAR